MSQNRAAVRYAKAVLDLAVDKKATDAVEKDMRAMVATLTSSDELAQVLSNPVVKSEVKQASVLAIFKSASEISKGLVSTLAANKRIDLLKDVAEKFIILNEQRKGESLAVVTSAVPLSPALEKKILAQVAELTGNKVALENKIDESIVGGFILRVGDMQYDASVANKLNTLKREFTNSL